MLGAEKIFVHVFLNTFQNEVNSFLEGREERYWCSKNGPLVIICYEESWVMLADDTLNDSAIAKAPFDDERERDKQKETFGNSNCYSSLGFVCSSKYWLWNCSDF